MNSLVMDNIICIGYLLLWIVTLIWYQRKNPTWDGGSAIICTYILYAFITILSVNDPMDIKAYVYLPMTVFPQIILFLMLIVALLPAIYHHTHPVKNIEDPQTRVLKLLSFVAIVAGLLQIPDIISNFGTGIVKLVTDTDAGKDAYEEMMKENGDAGSAINNLVSIIFNSVGDLIPFLCFYFISKKENIWHILGLLACVVISIMQPIMAGQRSPVMVAVLTFIVCFMLFKEFISKRIVKVVRYIGIVMLIVIAVPVAALTFSRFGDRTEASLGKYMTWYFGQCNVYFNNYALDDNGIRYGDRTFNFVKRLIDSDTPKNYVERRIKYHNLYCDDNLFVTFVGDFFIDFGPILAIIIIVLFNLFVVHRIRSDGNTVKLHQLLLLYFTLCICMQGGMYLFAYSDTANLKMLMLLLLYAYLVLHEKLLAKFPNEEKKDNKI